MKRHQKGRRLSGRAFCHDPMVIAGDTLVGGNDRILRLWKFPAVLNQLNVQELTPYVLLKGDCLEII